VWRTGTDEPAGPLRRCKEAEGTESNVPTEAAGDGSRYMQMSQQRGEERLPGGGWKAVMAELVTKGVDEGSSPRHRRWKCVGCGFIRESGGL
jgi:hypothetical protein